MIGRAHRGVSGRRPAVGCAVVALVLGAGPASAGDNDLVMARLADVVVDEDGAADAVGSNQDFRSLASELGVVLAPRLVEPADTLGFGGFEFTADVARTRVHTDRPYWRALAGSPNPANPDARHGDDYMTTVGMWARKGIWLPVPSFEVGIGAVHLIDSRIWAAQAYAKLAIIEGYHDLPIPSLAVRAGASRMMGSTELDLTVVSIDTTVSKRFGIAGLFSAAPYAGWNWLLVVPRSEVIDRTPHVDVRADPADARMNFVFEDQDDILRHRLFGGVKLRYYVFTLALEAALALNGASDDDRPGTSVRCSDAGVPTTECDSQDAAGRQATFTASAGFDF
jgi:hypothetical protein